MATNAPLGEMIIELSLDSSDFGKSLRSSQNEVKFWANSMKAGMKSADNAGKSMDKMKINVEGLTKTIEAQKKMVASLYESYQNSFSDGKATANTERYAQQLRNAEYQLANYEGQLKTAVGEMERLRIKTEGVTGSIYKKGEALEKAGANMKKFGEGMSTVGDKLTVGLTAPLVAGAGYAIKAASDYETAFTGVMKTVDEVVDSNGNVIYSYEDLSNGIRNLSKEIPVSAVELANLAEVSGQLGIEADGIVEFTRVVADMSAATILSGEEAAEGMARFLNVTGSGTDTVENLASSIVSLGNNMEANEKEILNMAQGWAATGALIGMTDDQIVAFSATLTALGIEGQAGAGAMQRILMQISNAVSTGGKELEAFAASSGMSAQEFAQAWQDDPTSAMQALVKNMAEVDAAGGDVIAMLDDLGIRNVQDQRVLLGLVQGHEELAYALGLSSNAYEEGTALSEEAQKAHDTFAGKLQVFRNKVEDVAFELGGPLLDALTEALNAAEPWIDTAADLAKSFSELDEEQQRSILGWIALAAAIGPVLSTGGRLVSVIGGVREGVGKLTKKLIDMYAENAGKKAMEEFGDAALNSADDVVDSATKSGAAASIFANPWVLGSAAVVAAIAGIGWALHHDLTEPQRAHDEAVKKTDGAYQDWFDGVVEGNAKIVEMNENAIAGAHETAEAYKEASQAIKQQNSDISQLSGASFGDPILNLTGSRWSNQTVDMNQDGVAQTYKVENMTPALKEFGLAKEQISALQQEVETYQVMMGNSFADIANTFAQGGIVTAEWANAHMTTFDEVSENTKARLEEMRQAQVKEIEENSFYSPEEQQKRIDGINQAYDAQIKAVEDAQQTINDILKRSSEENRALTDEEVLSMMEAYQQLAESTGESLSDIDGVAQLVGENLSAFTSQAGLEALEAAGIIDQSIVDAVANAETSEEKLQLLNQAIEEYSNKEIEPKEIKINNEETLNKLQELGYEIKEINGYKVVIPTDSSAPLTQEELNQMGLKAEEIDGQKVYIPSNTNAEDVQGKVEALSSRAKSADGTKVNIPSTTNADETKRKVNEARNAARDKTFTITGIVNWWQGSRLNPGNWETGTMYHPGGLSIVNDQTGPYFREYIQLPSGRGFIPEGRNVMLDLPRGSKVLKASDTIKAFGNIPQYAEGIGNISINSPVVRDFNVSQAAGTNRGRSDELLFLIARYLEDVRDEVNELKNMYDPNLTVVLDTGKVAGEIQPKIRDIFEREDSIRRRRR